MHQQAGDCMHASVWGDGPGACATCCLSTGYCSRAEQQHFKGASEHAVAGAKAFAKLHALRGKAASSAQRLLSADRHASSRLFCCSL